MDPATSSTFSALVVDDDAGVRQSLRLCLEAAGARVLGVGTKSGALEASERGHFDVVMLDLWLGSDSGLDMIPEILRQQPHAGLIVITAFATFDTAVEAMRRGAFDYLPKPFSPEHVRQAARRVLDAARLRRELSELRERAAESDAELFFDAQSPSFRALLTTAERAAAADCVVLLRGESGTGKNMLARWLRDHSARADKPFVSVSCPSLSTELMSSALFGHRKGSFTGAVSDTLGKVQEAEGGTLFLDEVGDLSAEAQARLLRFLNDRSYERLGETTERRADVRLIAATNRPLEAEVRAGRFREDLWFRLNVVSLTLPALRERREDLLPLAHHYLKLLAARQRREQAYLSRAAEEAILSYSWPGNLRELRNAVERALILCPSDTIEPGDLALPSASTADGNTLVLGAEASLEAVEREHIARVLSRSASLEAAARLLMIDATTLQRKRKRYGRA
jgi:NtrC-family two-component system response regulator AlgB